MLAYAAHRRSRRKVATLSLIVGAHALALGLLITARMEVGVFKKDPPLVIQPIPLPDDPPPPPTAEPKPMPAPPMSNLDLPPTRIVLPLDTGPVVVPRPTPSTDSPVIGDNPSPVIVPVPQPLPPPLPAISSKAQLLTSGDRLKPPYPDSKRRLEEEANLRLRLSIDDRGRVIAVEPVGSVDADFLAAARGHLLRHWRYRPAQADGRAVASTVVITLSFRLEDE